MPDNFPPKPDTNNIPPHLHPWRRSSRSTNGRQPISVQIQRGQRAAPPAPKDKIAEPVAAGHINKGPVGPLGPLGPIGVKDITWDDVVVAKPNPVSVKVSRKGQVIQLLVPVTIFVNDDFACGPVKKPVKKPVPPRRPLRNSNLSVNYRRPAQG